MKYPERDRKARRLIEAGVPYQGDRLAAALPFVAQRRLALDIGAHIGMWTVQLAQYFDLVVAFEPQQESYMSLVENTGHMAKVLAVPFAVGDADRRVRLEAIGLAAHVDLAATTGSEAYMRTLDSFAIKGVDFIKIDVEGFETFVLRGGEETIRRERPVIVVEQKHEQRYGLKNRAAVTLLKSWGAEVEYQIKHDFCLRWK